jgi:hypothetical protein
MEKTKERSGDRLWNISDTHLDILVSSCIRTRSDDCFPPRWHVISHRGNVTEVDWRKCEVTRQASTGGNDCQSRWSRHLLCWHLSRTSRQRSESCDYLGNRLIQPKSSQVISNSHATCLEKRGMYRIGSAQRRSFDSLQLWFRLKCKWQLRWRLEMKSMLIHLWSTHRIRCGGIVILIQR